MYIHICITLFDNVPRARTRVQALTHTHTHKHSHRSSMDSSPSVELPQLCGSTGIRGVSAVLIETSEGDPSESEPCPTEPPSLAFHGHGAFGACSLQHHAIRGPALTFGEENREVVVTSSLTAGLVPDGWPGTGSRGPNAMQLAIRKLTKDAHKITIEDDEGAEEFYLRHLEHMRRDTHSSSTGDGDRDRWTSSSLSERLSRGGPEFETDLKDRSIISADTDKAIRRKNRQGQTPKRLSISSPLTEEFASGGESSAHVSSLNWSDPPTQPPSRQIFQVRTWTEQRTDGDYTAVIPTRPRSIHDEMDGYHIISHARERRRLSGHSVDEAPRGRGVGLTSEELRDVGAVFTYQHPVRKSKEAVVGDEEMASRHRRGQEDRQAGQITAGQVLSVAHDGSFVLASRPNDLEQPVQRDVSENQIVRTGAGRCRIPKLWPQRSWRQIQMKLTVSPSVLTISDSPTVLSSMSLQSLDLEHWQLALGNKPNRFTLMPRFHRMSSGGTREQGGEHDQQQQQHRPQSSWRAQANPLFAVASASVSGSSDSQKARESEWEQETTRRQRQLLQSLRQDAARRKSDLAYCVFYSRPKLDMKAGRRAEDTASAPDNLIGEEPGSEPPPTCEHCNGSCVLRCDGCCMPFGGDHLKEKEPGTDPEPRLRCFPSWGRHETSNPSALNWIQIEVDGGEAGRREWIR
jgi:hypothetical protein